MWNSRKEEEPAPKFAGADPSLSHPGANGHAISSPPARPAGQDHSRAVSAVGKSVVIKGEVYSREDLVVEGEVQGTIELPEHRLTVGSNGNVKADVKAREITVVGSVNGAFHASDKIDIRKEAKVVGEVVTTRIAIEDGAYVKAEIDIVRSESTKHPEGKHARPAPVQPVTAVAGSVN